MLLTRTAVHWVTASQTVRAHGSVVLGADGDFTYTLDESLAAVGARDSFGVAVSDAGSGFTFMGSQA